MAPHLMRAQGAYKADKHARPTHTHTPTNTPPPHTHTQTHTHTLQCHCLPVLGQRNTHPIGLRVEKRNGHIQLRNLAAA